MDFVSPELSRKKRRVFLMSIFAIMISRLLENKGRSGYFLSWVLCVRS